jgi:hypothetical protein
MGTSTPQCIVDVSFAGLQILVGQLSLLPALPNTMPALHELCATPEVFIQFPSWTLP